MTCAGCKERREMIVKAMATFRDSIINRFGPPAYVPKQLTSDQDDAKSIGANVIPKPKP
jgi:hypothetical protein